jgi:hypothetical protein
MFVVYLVDRRRAAGVDEIAARAVAGDVVDRYCFYCYCCCCCYDSDVVA